MGEVTQLLQRASKGDPDAIQSVFERTYDELRRIAGAQMQGGGPGTTLQPTALVHEAWLRLVRSEMLERGPVTDRNHFLAIAARAMRSVAVDQARRSLADKRGGNHERIPLTQAVELKSTENVGPFDVIDLDDALERLASEHTRAARIVEMRFFGGMTIQDVAHALGVSHATAKRDWHVARIFLRESLRAAQRGSLE